MTTTVQVQAQSEYRDLPIDWLVESPTNPRQTFDEDAMKELSESIRANGVLQPLLVRPKSERQFEIVFGARRYRGSLLAAQETIPVCIREMTDAQVLEAQLVELSAVVKRFLLVSWSCTSWISPRRADFALIRVTISKGNNRKPDESRDNGRRLAHSVRRVCMGSIEVVRRAGK